MLQFWSVINCIFVHWTKKPTLMCKMSKIIHSKGLGNQNWATFGPRSCWMTPPKWCKNFTTLLLPAYRTCVLSKAFKKNWTSLFFRHWKGKVGGRTYVLEFIINVQVILNIDTYNKTPILQKPICYRRVQLLVLRHISVSFHFSTCVFLGFGLFKKTKKKWSKVRN